MEQIRSIVQDYPFVAMVRDCPLLAAQHVEGLCGQDTEFPGVVARPIGTFKTSSDYHYQTLR
jgi:CCR4-NOT transcription complex subunit 7/8